MRDKDRNTVKEKFSVSYFNILLIIANVWVLCQGFNKDMEEMSKLQQGYSIPDDDVRQALISENIELILPKYKIFYSK